MHTSPRDISAIASDLRSTRLEDLPAATLEHLAASVATERDAAAARIEALASEHEERLAAGDATCLRDDRQRLKRLESAWREHTDHLDDIEQARQRRILRDRLVASLGSERRLLALDVGINALIVLVLGLLYVEFNWELSPEASWAAFAVDTACCGVFLADFAFRLRLADHKGTFWRHHWIDFVTSIPIPPGDSVARLVRFGRVLRVARVVRVVRLLRLLRMFRLVMVFWRGMDKLKEVADVRLMKRSLRHSIVVLVIGAVAIYGLEGHAEQVGTVSEGLWWSFSTMVTGGFGDIYNPVSLTARWLTVLLVITGMILTGIFTATLTALVVGGENEEFHDELRELREQVDALQARVGDVLERESPAE